MFIREAIVQKETRTAGIKHATLWGVGAPFVSTIVLKNKQHFFRFWMLSKKDSCATFPILSRIPSF